MDNVYITWRIAMHNLWRVSWSTHILLYLTSVRNPELWFSKIFIQLIKMALNSDNVIIWTMINVGLNCTHSIMGIYDMTMCNKEECSTTVNIYEHTKILKPFCFKCACIVRINNYLVILFYLSWCQWVTVHIVCIAYTTQEHHQYHVTCCCKAWDPNCSENKASC